MAAKELAESLARCMGGGTKVAQLKEKAVKKPRGKKNVAVAEPAPAPVPVEEKPATPPVLEAPKPKPLSVREQIAAAKKNMEAGNILASIEEATDVKKDPTSAAAFLEAVDHADAFARSKAHDSDCCRNWNQLSLQQMQEQLAKWAAAGNENVIRPILDTLEAFGLTKVDVTSSYWRLVDVLRTARNVNSYRGLSQLMSFLLSEKRVVAVVARDLSPRDRAVAVILKWREEMGIIPIKHQGIPDPAIQGIWPYIKKAEEKAKSSEHR